MITDSAIVEAKNDAIIENGTSTGSVAKWRIEN